MAFRIHHHVTHGEVDCQVKGEVIGKLWLHGGGEPVVLKLRGNAWPDMAGCLLSFVNKSETVALREDLEFSRLQEGTVGDMTASRKVRVPAVPIEEFLEFTRRGEKAPERLANSLYLEWFSEANGRVVLETTDCEVTLSPPRWRLTPEEEEQRAADAAAGMDEFMGDLTQAIEFAESKVPWDKEDWDEFDHEKVLRESDTRSEKLRELMEKYMDHPDRDRIIAREMGWDEIVEMMDAQEAEMGLADDMEGEGSNPDGSAQGNVADDEKEKDDASGWNFDDYEAPEPDPATEGKEWVRTNDGDIKHPLSHRAFESAMFLWHRAEDLGLKEETDQDLRALLDEFQILSAKLAGALDSWAKDPSIVDPAHKVARMKRGLTHLHAAQAALLRVAEKGLLPTEDLDRARAELFSIREEMLRVMEKFRRMRG